MLVFPERFLHGDLPNLDYLHLYGPGSVWALGGWFKIFGVNLAAERFFGLLQQFARRLRDVLDRPRTGADRRPRLRADLRALHPPAARWPRRRWPGSVASGSGCIAISVVLEGRKRLPRRRRERVPLGGRRRRRRGRRGAVPARPHRRGRHLRRSPRPGARATSSGPRSSRASASPSSATSCTLVLVGPGVAFQGMVLDPVFKLRGGRKLPIPPSWGHLDGFLERSRRHRPAAVAAPLAQHEPAALRLVLPAPRDRHLRRRRRDLVAAPGPDPLPRPRALRHRDVRPRARPPGDPARRLRALRLGQLRSRRARFRSASSRSAPRADRSATSVGAALYSRRRGADRRRHSRSRTSPRGRSRTTPRRRSAATASRTRSSATAGSSTTGAATCSRPRPQLLAEVPKIAKPGAKLFVGTTDLRYTPYSDAWFYYMLPEYPPGTYYIEMDPGVANAKGSGLAEGPAQLGHRDPLRRCGTTGASRTTRATPAPTRRTGS